MAEIVPITGGKTPAKDWLSQLPEGAWFLASHHTPAGTVIKDYILMTKFPEACRLYDGIDDKEIWEDPVTFSQQKKRLRLIAVLWEKPSG